MAAALTTAATPIATIQRRLVSDVISSLPSQHPIECVGSMIDDGFRPVGEWIEVLEGEIVAVADCIEGGEDGRPVGGAVEEEAEGVEVKLVDFFAVFLEVNVFD